MLSSKRIRWKLLSASYRRSASRPPNANDSNPRSTAGLLERRASARIPRYQCSKSTARQPAGSVLPESELHQGKYSQRTDSTRPLQAESILRTAMRPHLANGLRIGMPSWNSDSQFTRLALLDNAPTTLTNAVSFGNLRWARR
jgi:hypothetical protein